VDGVNPDQVHARKGVCFAYFQTRECPVYRLHKDSLEARFARKFRHFW
jgi:hypothetical protein